MTESGAWRWSALSTRAKVGAAAVAAVQLSLLVAALTDLRRRDPAQVKGPRWAWALGSFVNFVGPLSYFLLGRRRS
jgi:hypothetical protein